MGAKEDAWQRGQNYCNNCKYYGASKKTPAMRCYAPENIYQGNYGQCYMKAPDHRNWHNKCDMYEEEERKE